MLAGMLSWGLLEVVRFGYANHVRNVVAYSYLTALSLAMNGYICFLREDKQTQNNWRNVVY